MDVSMINIECIFNNTKKALPVEVFQNAKCSFLKISYNNTILVHTPYIESVSAYSL